jgi:hypothetical protein
VQIFSLFPTHLIRNVFNIERFNVKRASLLML